MRVAPDQNLLIFDSDASGQWPLICVGRWWAPVVESQVLNLSGWSAKDAANLGDLNVEVQITPDGRFAVAFAGASWMAKDAFLLHAPADYVARGSDAIITVVDLKKWAVVGSAHTATMSEGSLAGVRVLNGDWLLLDFSLGRSPRQGLYYRYESRLLSLPKMAPGPACNTVRPLRLHPSLYSGQPDLGSVKLENDTACRDLLREADSASMEPLEILTYRGQDPLPAAVQESSHDLHDTEDEFFRGWGEYPYYLLYYENPPFESSLHRWYGLYGSQNRPVYDLTMFDEGGRKVRNQPMPSLMCGDPLLEKPGSACGCRVIDASEQAQHILAYCRTQRGDYAGMVRREWLTALSIDTLSASGFISLPAKDRQTLEQIALGDGKPYVVTLESGELLRIFAVPTHH